MDDSRICINAFWRSAGSVLLWSIEHCYQCQTAYEVTTSLAPFQNVSLSVLTKMLGDKITPQQNVTEIFSPIRERVQFVSEPRNDDINVVRQFLCGLYDNIPGMRGHKIIGYSNTSARMLPARCIPISVHKRFSRNFRRLAWIDTPGYVLLYRHWKDKHSTMPGIHMTLHPDPLLEAIDRLKRNDPLYLYLENGPYTMQMMYWIIYSYGAIRANRDNESRLFWIDETDISEIADAIRSHMGEEQQGCLENEINKPSRWFAWEKAPMTRWWAPKNERSVISDERLEISRQFQNVLSPIDDDIIQEAIDFIV